MASLPHCTPAITLFFFCRSFQVIIGRPYNIIYTSVLLDYSKGSSTKYKRYTNFALQVNRLLQLLSCVLQF